MTDTETKAPKVKPPRGGRKGGALFPKINLEQALEYTKKLVAKTHTGPQPQKIVLPGVFGNAGPMGKVRASALKQFNLLEGPATAYKATQLAKEIDAGLDEDLPSLLQRAFLNSKVFKQLFDTFHGDTVSKARIEQSAKGLDVHPTSADECARLFIESAVTAKLGTMDGESLVLARAGETAPAGEATSEEVEDGTEVQEHEEEPAAVVTAATNPPDPAKGSGNSTPPESEKPRAEKPAITLSLTVDPTSDPEKLEKQLKLLRQYGVI